MKRNILATLLLSGIALPVLAQPTLTSLNNPQIGDHLVVTTGNLADPGSAGAGQTWDFSAAVPSSSEPASVIDIISCASSADCGTFPGANVVWKFSGSDFRNYQSATATSLSNVGSKSSPTDLVVYTDGDKLLQFPFTYNNTFNDTIKAEVSGIMSMRRYGTSVVTADGYGTLKTPVGTFNNVLRVRRQQQFTDSIDLGGMWMPMNYTVDQYLWYSADSRMPLYAITWTLMDGEVEKVGQWTTVSSTGVAAVSSKATNFVVYPQPAKGQLHLRFTTAQPAPYALELTDITGRTVAQQTAQMFPAGTNEIMLDVSHLNAGIYFLQLKNGHQHVAAQKVQVL